MNGSADGLDQATSEIASGSKLGVAATEKLSGEGVKRPWPPLINMDAAVKAFQIQVGLPSAAGGLTAGSMHPIAPLPRIRRMTP